MKRVAFAVGVCLAVASLAYADRDHDHDHDHSGPTHRAAPPAWQAHPPGVHPHGPIVRQHGTRVLAPKMFVHGAHPIWNHWSHPEFSRPVYYWDWALVHNVTCVAEDSYGDQYPVTMATYPGFGLDAMTEVEDTALDRCFNDSGQDPSCFLATCSHF